MGDQDGQSNRGRATLPSVSGVVVRDAQPEEYNRIGEITVAAYVADGFLHGDSEYAEELRDAARRAREAQLIVAVDESTGEVLGSVTFCLPGSPWAQIAGPDEAEFRMLSVEPAARGRGAGEALVEACVRRARAAGCRRLVLLTTAGMTTAHRLYERLGFRRTAERDWWPRPDFRLMAYALAL